jgi:hypothetical protein
LIDHGADASYCFPADNASVVFMLVRSFRDWPQSEYRQGDFVLTADLLVEAGAPIHEIHEDGPRHFVASALSQLRDMEVREGTRRSKEHKGLISVLERRYWQKYGHNPFLRASPDEAAWLLLKGAADDDAGRVDITRVRSIKPDLRNNVLDAIIRFKGMRESFVHVMLTMKNPNSISPICSLRGHESTILPVIAAFAGSRGWSLRKLNEARNVVEDAIQRFNEDNGSGHDDVDEIDEDDEDDDSFEVDDDDGEENDNEIDEDSDDDDEPDEFIEIDDEPDEWDY